MADFLQKYWGPIESKHSLEFSVQCQYYLKRGISAGRGEINLKLARKHSLQASFHRAKTCCAGGWGEEIASWPVVDPAGYSKTFQARHAH